MSDKESREKLAKYCEDVYYIEHDKEWCFFYDVNKNDPDSVFLQNKVKRLMELLNRGETKYIHMDIQNELYDIL